MPASEEHAPPFTLAPLIAESNTVVSAVAADALPGGFVARLDLSRTLRLANMEDVLFVELDVHEANNSTYQRCVLDLLGDPTFAATIHIISVPQLVEPSFLLQLAHVQRSVILDHARLRRIPEGTRFEDAIHELLLQDLGVGVLSVYRAQGAVVGTRFFGRQQQLRHIEQRPDHSYLVSGPRMSGKSSLLLEAKRRIDISRLGFTSAFGSGTVYVDCRERKTIAEFICDVLKQLKQPSLRTLPKKWTTPDRWPEFFAILRWHAKKAIDRTLNLFFDEYDQVLQYPNVGHRSITWEFRALQQHNSATQGHIQFVIAGSKNLAKLCRSQKGDFHNFLDYESCRLGNFDIGTAKDLLMVPLRDLGFKVPEGLLLATLLLRETGGRPASIQHLCLSMLKRLAEHPTTKVNEDLLMSIVRSGSFLQFYQDSLDENTDPLEQYILCVQANRSAARAFSADDIHTLNKKLGIRIDSSLVNDALSDLVNSGFLSFDEAHEAPLRYRLSVPTLRRLYNRVLPKRFIDEMTSFNVARAIA